MTQDDEGTTYKIDYVLDGFARAEKKADYTPLLRTDPGTPYIAIVLDDDHDDPTVTPHYRVEFGNVSFTTDLTRMEHVIGSVVKSLLVHAEEKREQTGVQD